jgi:K+-sensing histidine kinase KdpD
MTFAGVAVILAGALVVAAAFVHTGFRDLMPFAIVPVVVAAKCGVLSSLVGSVLSAVVFAYFLSAPMGSFHLSSDVMRSSLGWMLLVSIAFSFLLFPSRRHEHHRHI